MAISRIDPFDILDRISEMFDFDYEDFDRIFELPERFISTWGLYEGEWSPALDMYEDDDAYFVKIDLPGMEPEEIDIQVTEDVLTIKGERKQPDEETEKARCQRDERYYGTFHRTVPLNIPVDTENVDAKMKDGILYITLPKKAEVKPKKIDIKVS
ncbi:MAG: Hsp20/alpha crystallin family protein [Spirochaetes bacterium]|nr:MAG: Hsp20/alpha crystallin family protein [Spirochaetota bacterium]